MRRKLIYFKFQLNFPHPNYSTKYFPLKEVFLETSYLVISIRIVACLATPWIHKPILMWTYMMQVWLVTYMCVMAGATADVLPRSAHWRIQSQRNQALSNANLFWEKSLVWGVFLNLKSRQIIIFRENFITKQQSLIHNFFIQIQIMQLLWLNKFYQRLTTWINKNPPMNQLLFHTWWITKLIKVRCFLGTGETILPTSFSSLISPYISVLSLCEPT